MRTGLLSILQRMQADKPGILAFANLSNAQNPSNSWAEYVGQFEWRCAGKHGWFLQFDRAVRLGFVDGLLAYQNQMTLLNSNKYGVFAAYNITSNGADQINAYTPYQAMRHAFAFCLVVGNARCAFESSGNDPDRSAALWFDEES